MKKISILPIILTVLTATAFAADTVGDPCQQTTYSTAQVGGDVLSCVDGKLKVTGHVGSTHVTLSVQLMEGDKNLTSTTVTALDGQPTPIRIGSERSYTTDAHKEGGEVTVKDGFFMAITPTITPDGKIGVVFVAQKSEVTSVQTLKQGETAIPLPQVNTIEIKPTLALENGKKIIIPFGPLVEPMTSVKMGKPLRTQYSIKLLATKI